MQNQRFVSHPLLYPDVVEEREYQVKIAHEAYDRNTLVILPTALGKTVISALAAAQALYNYRSARVLVMAPTRPLILQHRSSFQRMLRLPEDQFVLLTGKSTADYRRSVWRGHQRIVFATPEVVRNDLLEKRLPNLDGFALLIFDECHRAVKEYAYTEVASSYLKSAPYPLILGMTASPGSDPDRISMVCRSLSIERVEYRSEEDADVRPYINPVTVESRSVALPAQYLPADAALRQMLNEKVRWLQNRGFLKRDTPFVTRRDLIEVGSEMRYRAELTIEEESGPAFSAISVQSQALTLFHMLELLETQGGYTLKRFIERLEEEGHHRKSHLAITSDGRFAVSKELLESPACPDHPKVHELISVVSEQVKSNRASRVLVFTQYRDTASHLVEELNRAGAGAIRAERFVGQSSKLRDKGLTQDQQASLIEDLRKGYVNALCCTSIAEEGLDIPEVDLVVFYEPIPSEIRYIQRRGRTGRKSPGRVMILATEGTADTGYLQASQRRTEMMRSITSSLTEKLARVFRSGERPPPEPMDDKQIAALEYLSPEAPLSTVKREEYEKTKSFDRTVARARHDLYMRVLDEAGGSVDEELLYDETEELGYSRSVVFAAMQGLLKRRYLVSTPSKEGTMVSLALKNIPDAMLMTVEVKKVLLGGALVIIDGEREAMLDAANYSGPRELIKKGRRFKALCELYSTPEALNLNVRQVLQVQS
jgi:Fanconi anemia group M protein